MATHIQTRQNKKVCTYKRQGFPHLSPMAADFSMAFTYYSMPNCFGQTYIQSLAVYLHAATLKKPCRKILRHGFLPLRYFESLLQQRKPPRKEYYDHGNKECRKQCVINYVENQPLLFHRSCSLCTISKANII